MAYLIKKVEGIVPLNLNSNVIILKSIESDIQREDYINLIGFKAYLQDMSRAEITILLQKPLTFGLINIVPSVTLEISY